MKWRRLALAAHVTATHVGHYTLWHSAGRGARLKGVWCNQWHSSLINSEHTNVANKPDGTFQQPMLLMKKMGSWSFFL